MKISEAIPIMKAQLFFRRTPCGRSVTDYAAETLDAAISDQKNADMDATRCKNCCIIVSSLLVPEGCPNCGGKDLTTEIMNESIG